MATTQGTANGDKKKKAALGLIFLTVFIDLVGFGLIIPVLPHYAQQLIENDAFAKQLISSGTFGQSPVTASATVVGLIIAAYSLMQFLLMPFWGRLSDKVGRKPILLISLAASALGYLTWGFASSIGMLLLARLIAGAGNANIAVAQAYVTDVTTEENRTKGMAMIGIAFGLGFVLGPTIGGFCASLGLQTIGFIAAGLSLIDLVLTAAILPEPEKRSDAATQRYGFGPATYFQTLNDPKLRESLLIFFLSTFAFANMEATIVLLTEQYFNFTPKDNSYLFLYVGFWILMVQGGLVRRMAKKNVEKRMVACGTLLIAIGLVLCPAFHNVAGVYVALAILAIGSGINTPSNQSILSKLAPPDRIGSVMGVGQSLSTLGRILGPAAGGALFQFVSPAAPYWLGAVAMVVAFALSRKLPDPQPIKAAPQPAAVH